MNPFIELINTIIDIYIWIIIAMVVMSWLVGFNVVNMQNDFVRQIRYALFRLTEPGTAALRLTARDSEGAETAFVFNVTVLPDFDGDGLEDAVDQDDDNDGAPDATDPAPLDPSIVSPTVTEPAQSGLPLLLLLALLAVAGGAIAFAAARRRRRGT